MDLLEWRLAAFLSPTRHHEKSLPFSRCSPLPNPVTESLNFEEHLRLRQSVSKVWSSCGCSRKDSWTFGNWAKASQEKSGSLKGNSVSTGHNPSDHPHRCLVCLFLQQSRLIQLFVSLFVVLPGLR